MPKHEDRKQNAVSGRGQFARTLFIDFAYTNFVYINRDRGVLFCFRPTPGWDESANYRLKDIRKLTRILSAFHNVIDM